MLEIIKLTKGFTFFAGLKYENLFENLNSNSPVLFLKIEFNVSNYLWNYNYLLKYRYLDNTIGSYGEYRF